MREYDIIAIGGGSGGIATMNRAGEHDFPSIWRRLRL